MAEGSNACRSNFPKLDETFSSSCHSNAEPADNFENAILMSDAEAGEGSICSQLKDCDGNFYDYHNGTSYSHNLEPLSSNNPSNNLCNNITTKTMDEISEVGSFSKEVQRESSEVLLVEQVMAADAQLKDATPESSTNLKMESQSQRKHNSAKLDVTDNKLGIKDSNNLLAKEEVCEITGGKYVTMKEHKTASDLDGPELTEIFLETHSEDISSNYLRNLTPGTSIPRSSSTSDMTNPQNLRVQMENQIVSELNDVLNVVGLGIKKSNLSDTNKCSPEGLNIINGSEGSADCSVRCANPVLRMSDFAANLQQQLARFQHDSQKFRDDHYSEVQALERTLNQERLRLEQQEGAALQVITQLKNDLEKKHQLLESANKERDAMVVKYAMSEKTVITIKKDLELAERRLKEANRARDLLVDRLKTVQAEKEKANNLLETKGQEYSVLNRENQRLKEDLRWTQNKLKTEADGRKETEQRVTDLIRRLEEARLETEQARKDAQSNIKAFQVSQENKAVTLDHQLREQHARLILERHERADNEAVLKQLQSEVDVLKLKQQALIDENNQLSLKVQTLEKERLDGDQRLSRLKQESDTHHQEVADLRERLAAMESLRVQLQHYEDQLSTCRNEMERLRQINVELQQDAAACREREAELLDFTQKLTEKNVRLQSEFSALEAKAQVLESEQQPLTRKLGEAETRLEVLEAQLKQEQKLRHNENSLLARHLAEKTHCLEQTKQQLEDSQGEIDVLKRKHAASIRELTREIQQIRKRQEASEINSVGSQHSSNSSNSLALCSRTSSSSSLNTVCETSQSSVLPPVIFPNGQEPDKQALIERLVKLQRENAKRAEKLDFMEEHSQVLVAELQKKTRLIQNFIMKMPAGALSSESMDQNKAELAKRSGIMASMYGSKTDEAMSLELSMEINRKLQAVLEDTLLKNITLKENIDTLGEEISRLSSKGAIKH